MNFVGFLLLALKECNGGSFGCNNLLPTRLASLEACCETNGGKLTISNEEAKSGIAAAVERLEGNLEKRA
ncbi:hypothetical protein AAHA92_29311 [Salvia divinorum]|uniref:Uncharacterized protein n=1 Tax=Salvia divinorum TaxID=28513 RepID=A0ABD1FY06_SALDI